VTALVLLVREKPPSLRDICADKYFCDMRQFIFTTSTTFNQYVDAVVSGRVLWERLLSPGFPSIHISFTYNTFSAKFYPTCAPHIFSNFETGGIAHRPGRAVDILLMTDLDIILTQPATIILISTVWSFIQSIAFF